MGGDPKLAYTVDEAKDQGPEPKKKGDHEPAPPPKQGDDGLGQMGGTGTLSDSLGDQGTGWGARLAALTTTKEAKKAAKEAAAEWLALPKPPAQLGSWVAGIPDDKVRTAFLKALYGKINSALRSTFSGKIKDFPKKGGASKYTKCVQGSWPADLAGWAKQLQAWAKALPEPHGPKVESYAKSRAKWIVANLKSPNVGAFKDQQPLRKAIYDAFVASHGEGWLQAVYAAAGKQDGWTADANGRKKEQLSKQQEEPFDRTAANMLRFMLDLHLGTVEPLRVAVQTVVKTNPNLGAKAQLDLFRDAVQAYVKTFDEFKLALKPGQGNANDEDYAALAKHAGRIKDHVDFINKTETDLQALHLQTAKNGKVKQELGDDAGAQWWQPMMVPGLQMDKRPEHITMKGSSARTGEQVDQVGLHQGHRTTSQLVQGWKDDGKGTGSHFAVNPDGSVSQLAPAAARAGHIVDGNKRSLGIDMQVYAASPGDDAYMKFLEESPAQMVALCKVVLAAQGQSGGSMSLDPTTQKYEQKTSETMDDSADGVYAHRVAKNNDHGDPGLKTTHAFYKWVYVVAAWEKKFGPINATNVKELKLLQDFMNRAEQQSVATYHDGKAPYVSEVSGKVSAVKNKKKGKQKVQRVTITTPALEQGGKPTKTDYDLPRTTDHGAVLLAVAKADEVTKGQALVRLNPFDNKQHGVFKAKVDQEIAKQGL